MKSTLPIVLLLSTFLFCTIVAHAAPPDTARGDKMLAGILWRAKLIGKAARARRWRQPPRNGTPINAANSAAQLFDMLGLNPLPEKTDLKPVITGTLEKNTPEGDIVVEKIHFQSLTGLYVTANLYRPKLVKEPLPTILYVCGHSQQKKGQRQPRQQNRLPTSRDLVRPQWVCLSRSSIRSNSARSRGFITGRIATTCGGGSIADTYPPASRRGTASARSIISRRGPRSTRLASALRAAAAAERTVGGSPRSTSESNAPLPCAGITDLKNHVVDGCVEGHCDCMYLHNTEQWDYATVAALVAPRPLLIVNTDSDPIFPLDGVVRIFEEARRIYKLDGAADKIALAIGPGGHKDIQEIQVPAFRWFNKHLQGHDRPITLPAEKMFEYEELRVFDKLPEDAINAKIHETFVAKAPDPKVPESKEAWQTQREALIKQLRERTFAAWPKDAGSIAVVQVLDCAARRRSSARLGLCEQRRDRPAFVLGTARPARKK